MIGSEESVVEDSSLINVYVYILLVLLKRSVQLLSLCSLKKNKNKIEIFLSGMLL
jgi:hypothetical protein